MKNQKKKKRRTHKTKNRFQVDSEENKLLCQTIIDESGLKYNVETMKIIIFQLSPTKWLKLKLDHRQFSTVYELFCTI